MYFPEIIKLQSGKRMPYIAHILLSFRIIAVASLSLKHARLPQFSFWISIALAKICFPRIVINHTKILPN